MVLDQIVVALGPDMQKLVKFKFVECHDAETEILSEQTLLRGRHAKIEVGMENGFGEMSRVPITHRRLGGEDHRRPAIELGVLP